MMSTLTFPDERQKDNLWSMEVKEYFLGKVPEPTGSFAIYGELSDNYKQISLL